MWLDLRGQRLISSGGLPVHGWTLCAPRPGPVACVRAVRMFQLPCSTQRSPARKGSPVIGTCLVKIVTSVPSATFSRYRPS